MNFFQTVGRGIDRTGRNLHLPEFGISEFFGYSGTKPGALKANAPYGLNPTAAQSAITASNPTLSNPNLFRGTTPIATAPPPKVHTLGPAPAAVTATGTGRAGSAGATPVTAAPGTPSATQSLGFFQGKEYYDPAELYADQLSYLDNLYGGRVNQFRQAKTRQLDKYGRQKADVNDQLAELLGLYDTQEKEEKGNIATYYGNLGDIYQSSEGVRLADLATNVEGARTKTRKQSERNISAIDEAIAEYLGEADQTEQGLAKEYQGSRDEIGNNVISDLGSRLNIRDLVGRNVETDLTPEEIARNDVLLGNLQSLRGNQFGGGSRLNRGQLETNPILAYLAALA